MNVVWRKIWRDLMGNKVRTTLVVLSIAVGVFALGLVFNLRDALQAWMQDDYRLSNASHLLVRMAPFEQYTVRLFQREFENTEIESQVSLSIQWRMGNDTVWRDATLVAKPDYAAQHIDRIELQSGELPTGRALAVERCTAEKYGITIGTNLVVKSGDTERTLPVTGIVRRYNTVPPDFGGSLWFYTTPETTTSLTGQEGLTQIAVRLSSPSNQNVSAIIEWFFERMQQSNMMLGIWTAVPTHFAQNAVDSVLAILTVMGTLALALSAFLITNTMSAIITQQVWQIGVMKTIGATFNRIVQIYLLTALIYGGLALVLAIPLAATVAYWIASNVATLGNIPVGEFRATSFAIGLQVVVGLFVPILAAMIPVLNGARITPRQAMVSRGLNGGCAPSILDRLFSAMRFLSRPMMLSLRNAFRRKARIVLTLLTLVLSGVMFIAVISTSASLDNTIALQVQEYGYDVMVWLDRPQRATQSIAATENVASVASVEVWSDEGGMMTTQDGSEFYARLFGLPPNSTMFKPRIIEGRWLKPDDELAIVINRQAAVERNVQVGDKLTWKFDSKKRPWTVVGVIVDPSDYGANCFVPIDTLATMSRFVGRGRMIAVQGTQHDVTSQHILVERLRVALETANLKAVTIDAAAQKGAQIRSQFDIVVNMLLTMTLLTAIVGSIGLMGTLSINVVERTREIGVMRAIGATPFVVIRLFIGEGIVVGVLSWLIAVPLSYPMAWILGDTVGNLLLQTPLDFVYSREGAIEWLLIVIGLSALASLLPALRAAQWSVRETLAYE